MTRQERSSLDQHMRGEVDAFIASNMPARQFCKDKPYTHHKLNYWVGKIRKEQEIPKDGSQRGFFALKIGSTRSQMAGNVCADIIYPNGIRIAIYEPLSATLLKLLL
jgi:hypothetical protein